MTSHFSNRDMPRSGACVGLEFSAEDASRTEYAYLLEVLRAVHEAGATVLNVPDTVGYSLPHEYAEMVRKLVRDIPTAVISVDCHNDLGLAVANSIAAIGAGARQVECTINGIGERAGNTSLEEIVMALKVRRETLGVDTRVHAELLAPTSEALSTITGVWPQPNKAIVGRNAFAHEAGIHQHGILANPLTYEIMTPASVGVGETLLVLGKHSGQHAVEKRLRGLGVSVDRERLEDLTTRVKELADRKKFVYDDDTRTPQSDLIVFQVYVPGEAKDLPRLYWRGQVYDRYEDGRWLTTSDSEIRREPLNGDMKIPYTDNRLRLAFTFDVMVSGQSIVDTPPQPIWVNHDTILLSSGISDETDEEPFLDILAIRPSPSFKSGDLYRTRALLANPTTEELREAGEVYPDWVKERYLQLPEGFSPRIQKLAKQITAPYKTPYDKVLAITNYLRREIEYTSVIYLPNETVDPLEYVILDAKRGSCNYYATAEVLMLRSIGIPARLAVGYAQGQPNIQKSLYFSE